MDFTVTSAVPVWLGDHTEECHVQLEPGLFDPQSFIQSNFSSICFACVAIAELELAQIGGFEPPKVFLLMAAA